MTDVKIKVCITNPSNNPIIFFSGDADMKPAIEAVIKLGWKVEVFMWNHALLNQLKKLAQESPCAIYDLDFYKDKITFNRLRFPIANNHHLLHIVRAKGILCKMKANSFKGNEPTEHLCNTISETLKSPFQYFWMEE